MQIVDYHIHTALCRHAEGSMREYVEQALAVELGEMGFSDHFPIYHLSAADARRQEYAMEREALPEYVWRVSELSLEFPEIPIRLGIEMDYVPGYEESIAGWLNEFPFDYVIGSVHFIDEWSVDDPRHTEIYDDWPPERIWKEYFNRVQAAARSQLFDILGHVDLIKKLGHEKPSLQLRRTLYQQTAAAMAEGGVCVEVNTAGLRAPAQEIYPARELLAMCYEEQVPITLGSDAHRPEEVGRDLETAVGLARAVGYDGVAVFEERKRSFRFFGT